MFLVLDVRINEEKIMKHEGLRVLPRCHFGKGIAIASLGDQKMSYRVI
jgi:hypothetical protein